MSYVRARWECCGRGTRLAVCLVCGRDAPWKGSMPRQHYQGKDAEGRQLRAVCRNCGQALHDPVSVERGYGPDCWLDVSGEV